MQAPNTPESASSVFSTLQNPPTASVTNSLSLVLPPAAPLHSVPPARAAATQTQEGEATSAHPINTMLSTPVTNATFSLSSLSPSTLLVNGSPRFEAVQELQPPPFAASSAAPAPSVSAKSLAPLSTAAPQRECQKQPKPTNGRDNTNKRDISASSHPLEPEQGAKLLPSTRHDAPSLSPLPNSSPSYRHPIGDRRGLAGDLVAAAPAASAAAAALPSHPTSSSSSGCGPIPTNQTSEDTTMHNADDEHHAVNNNNNNMHNVASSSSGSASSASASTSAPLLSATARLSAALLLLFNQRHTAATSSTSTPPSSSSCCVDISCHCLVVDDSRLAKDSPAERQYQQALQLGQPSDAQALLQHVRGWLSTQHALEAASIAVAYAPARQPRRVHVNFSSLAGLAAALLACPFLVRCGSLLSGSAWAGAASCGDVKRHQLPELLQLSCIPSASSSGALSQLLNTDAAALLREMQLDYTAWWPASSMAVHNRGNANNNNNNNEPPSRITLLVLPRSILTLSADIERLHGRFSLWGGKVRVQGVNQPSLRRCTQCDEIGHDSSKCAKYSGLALRLLFKQPLPFAAMLSIRQTAQAKLAFLGSSVDEMQPSRRLTLLFDAQADDLTKMEEILARLAPVISDLGSDLQQAPDVVNVQHRHRECRECGWLPPSGQPASSHVCPFSMQHGPLPFRSQRPAAAITAPAAAQQSSSRERASVARDSSASPDTAGVCKSWRRNKTCPRLDKQQRCEFQHPAHSEPANVCFEWQRTGVCSRGLVCRFSASHNKPLTAQEGPAAAASTTHAAVPVVPSVAIFPPLSSSEQQESKEESEAKETETEAAAHAPASPPSSARSAAAQPTPSKKRSRLNQEAQAADNAAEATSNGNAAALAGAASSSKKVSSALSSTSWADMVDSDEDQEDCQRLEASAQADRRRAASKSAAPISSLSSLGMPSPSRSKGTTSITATTAAAADTVSPSSKKFRGSSLSRSSSDATTAASSAAPASMTGSSRSSSSSSQRSSQRGR